MDNTDKVVLGVAGVGGAALAYMLYRYFSAPKTVTSETTASQASQAPKYSAPPASPVASSFAPSADYSRQYKVNQEMLILAGYSLAPYGADGRPGPTTTNQIKAFQAKEGLPQTGTFDAATVDRLKLRTAGKTVSSVQAARDALTKMGPAVVGPDGKTYVPTEGGGI